MASILEYSPTDFPHLVPLMNTYVYSIKPEAQHSASGHYRDQVNGHRIRVGYSEPRPVGGQDRTFLPDSSPQLGLKQDSARDAHAQAAPGPHAWGSLLFGAIVLEAKPAGMFGNELGLCVESHSAMTQLLVIGSKSRVTAEIWKEGGTSQNASS